MAHIPLLRATVYSTSSCSESTPPPSQAQNSAIEYEQLETSRVFGCHYILASSLVVVNYVPTLMMMKCGTHIRVIHNNIMLA